MPTTDSPLRYPGGKTQLTPFVVDLLSANNLRSGVYAEPFAGGAGLAWRLLLNGHVAEVWLNDIDPAIYSFWSAVINFPDDLCELVARTEVTIGEWRRQREIVSERGLPSLALGFATLFMNRTNRSGIIGGGVIGGQSQEGNYKIDCRFNKNELISKIQRIASYRDVVKLSQLDARLCIPKWAKNLPTRALMNIDPPYFAKGQELYTNFYTPENHKDLARLIRRLQCHWMLTYDDAPEVEKLYAGLPIYRKGLTYYAQVKRRANELLILSPKLVRPSGIAEHQAEAA